MTDTKSAPTDRPPKETWLDWIGPLSREDILRVALPMLTRGELLDRLHEKGFEATERDLAFWQRKGALPYPSKRRKGRTAISIYPVWLVDLVALLRQSQQYGLPLDQIGPMLKKDVARFYEFPFDDEMRTHLKRQQELRTFFNHLPPLLEPLSEAIKAFEAAGQVTIDRVDVIFHQTLDALAPNEIAIRHSWEPLDSHSENNARAPLPIHGNKEGTHDLYVDRDWISSRDASNQNAPIQ